MDPMKSSARLDELAAIRASTRTPKSPLKIGGVKVIDDVRKNPPSIWKKK